MTAFTTNLAQRRSTFCRAPRHSLMGYVELYRQRQALKRLSDTQLSDLGLSHDMAQKEANRPFWDAPDHWAR
jgi:uncharacterized protein YjiS (DUF1127 family)